MKTLCLFCYVLTCMRVSSVEKERQALEKLSQRVLDLLRKTSTRKLKVKPESFVKTGNEVSPSFKSLNFVEKDRHFVTEVSRRV